MTPRQIDRAFRAQQRIAERQHNERAWLAWHIAALPRVKQFPKIDKLLVKSSRGSRRVRQTPEQMLSIAKMLAGISFPDLPKDRPKV